MIDLSKSLKKNSLLEDIVKGRKGKVNLKHFSPIHKSHTKISPTNILINKTDLKELSKLSDRPIFVNKTKTNMQKEIRTEDKLNLNNQYNNSNYNNNIDILKNRNIPKKNIVIFTECPKKLSDYILKDKSKRKKKVYHLTYLDENDLNYEKFIQERKYQNYYANKDSNPRIIKKQKTNFNLNSYDDHNYLINKVYASNTNNINNNIINNRINNRMNNNYSMKNLCVNNQNNDQLKVVKIQSIWRGYLLRKSLINGLNNFYNILRIFNCLDNIFFNNFKPSFKLFLYFLQKKRNNILYNKSKIKPSKTNIKSKPTKSKEYKNINNKPSKEIININKVSVIDRRNINVFIPGGKKSKDIEKGFIYKRKKNSLKNSPLLKKKNINLDNNNRENIFKAKKNMRAYDGFKNVNYKNKVKTGINNIIKYIKNKFILMYCPLLLYRLRILQKMKFVEHKYQCLFNIIKIKEKLNLYSYFHKYRNIIFSQTINFMLSEKKAISNSINNSSLNFSKERDRSYDNIQNIKLNTKKRYILKKSKENINNNNLKNKENNQNITNFLLENKLIII